MSIAIGKKIIRFVKIIVDTAIIFIILLFIAADCYAAWDSKQGYEWAEAASYEIYKPSAEDKGLSFNELKEINPDVFAWLSVYGTNIDYPVVQGENNLKYENTNALGQYSLSGAIFLDARNSKDFSDFSSILYGHHMEKNAMFGEIGLFAEKEYFDARRYGMLYYDGQEHGIEFFAFLQCDAYDTDIFRTRIVGQEAREAYVDLIFETAAHTRDISITTNDRLVLLSTCSPGSTNGRDILVGRITDELYEDVFKIADAENALSIDGLPGLWARLPGWAQMMIAFVLPLLILLALLIRKKRSLKKRDNSPSDDNGDKKE